MIVKLKQIRWELAILLGIAALLAWGTALERQQQRIADNMIRLHVVANSDSREDQAVKLRVRDAVLETAAPYLEAAGSSREARVQLEAILPRLCAVANQTLRDNGYTDTATVRLGRELFSTRHYDGFSLPGGYYDSLRVTIGAGEGHNWWCVVYPQLCMSAVSEQKAVAVMGGMEQEDAAVLTGEYEFRFRTLELFEDILGFFRSRQAQPTR